MLVVNLYGGPGAGKSTLASDIFVKLKRNGIRCELVSEFAKDLTWDESYKTLQNQVFIFANQLQRLWRLRTKVDVAIMDSPLLLTIPYDSTHSENFLNLVYEKYSEYQNLDYMVKRVIPYEETGRKETELQAIEIDEAMEDILSQFGLLYTTILPDEESTQKIVDEVIMKLDK